MTVKADAKTSPNLLLSFIVLMPQSSRVKKWVGTEEGFKEIGTHLIEFGHSGKSCLDSKWHDLKKKGGPSGMLCCVETACGTRQHPVVKQLNRPWLFLVLRFMVSVSSIPATHSFFFLDGSPASQPASLWGLRVLAFLPVTTDVISWVEAAKAH